MKFASARVHIRDNLSPVKCTVVVIWHKTHTDLCFEAKQVCTGASLHDLKEKSFYANIK